jgi:hypothetical protein
MFSRANAISFHVRLSTRVETLPFKIWRDHIKNMIQTADYKLSMDNSFILHAIQEKIAYFEDELPQLKDAATILELALWKIEMNEKSHQKEMTSKLELALWKMNINYSILNESTTRHQKKIISDDANS